MRNQPSTVRRLLRQTFHNDSGSAPLEFLAFGLPGVFIILIAMQVVNSAYLGTVAYDAAAEAAWVAALADGTDQAAQDRGARVVSALSGVRAESISVSHGEIAGVATSQVTVRVTSNILGFGAFQVSQSVEAVDETK